MPDDDSDSDEVSEAEQVSAEEDGGEEDGGEEAEPAEPAKPAEPAAPLSFSERLQLTLEANLAKVSDLFRDWDKNADGLITRAEFTRALGTLRNQARQTKSNLDRDLECAAAS